MFYPRDPEIYDELFDVIPATAITKGTAAVVQDVFGFYIKDRESVGEEVVFVYRMRQVRSDKSTGTGTEIVAGDRLYYIVANDNVQNTPVGTPGTDSYFCGWAKRDATASATEVLMNFDGTRYDETL